ncbi:trypsin I-P1-like [Thrips palmi]|uniref:Trypsin I-P1-like n=1 Tax=Thrips palmi TaxID=161013 RepID=A0A6P8Z5L7_THRPL|nr:trypsin I-P1-like [Thrips palmi]
MMCDGLRTFATHRGGPPRPPQRLSPPPPTLVALLVPLLLVFLSPSCSAAGTPLTLSEGRAILDKWRPLVHGAVAVKLGELNYQASVRLYSPAANQHVCGGAVISAWHVLTAARCFSYGAALAPEAVFVVAGAVRRSALNEGDVETAVRKVVNIARHPEFSSREQRHDLALLTLSTALPVERLGRVGAVPLPVGGIRADLASTCVVSGWGNNTAQTAQDADALLSAEVPFVDREMCLQMFEPRVLPKGVICTAHQKGGVGACVGDTGGPLVCNGFLAGTVSWGSGCGANARPTVYTSVVDHVEWVRAQMASFEYY